MRLTELAGSEVFLDLFIIADGKAGNEMLETIYSDTYDAGAYKQQPWGGEPLPSELKDVWHPVMRGYLPMGASIGHPSAEAEMWDHCSVTRFQHRFQPGRDWGDLEFSLGYPEPFKAVFYSQKWAEQTSWTVFCRGIAIAIPLVFLLFWGRFRKWRIPRLGALAACVVVFAAAGIGKEIVLRSIPTVPVRTESGTHTPNMNAFHYNKALEKFKANTVDFDKMGLDELSTSLDVAFKDGSLDDKGYFKPGEQGDSPGEWSLYEDRRGVFLRLLGQSGYPEDIPLRIIPEKERTPLPRLKEEPDDPLTFVLDYNRRRDPYYFHFNYLKRHSNYFRLLQGFAPDKGIEPQFLTQEVTALLRKDGMCLARKETRLVGGGKEVCFWSAELSNAWYPLKYALDAVADGDNFQGRGPREEIDFTEEYFEVIVFKESQAMRNRCKRQSGRSLSGSDLRAATRSLLEKLDEQEPFWKGEVDSQDMPDFEILEYGPRIFENQLRWTLDGDESARYNDLDFSLMEWEKQPGFSMLVGSRKEGGKQ
jgi:hypothetical protein